MARMGDFRKKIKSLAHRYYSWLTLLSMENTDLDHEEEYDEYDINPDKVRFFSKHFRSKLSRLQRADQRFCPL